MNIFVVDECPLLAASQLCDKHVVKMVLETAQLASTTFHNRGLDAPYRKTHENHPSAVWARTSRQNFDWMTLHGLGLCDEYTARYGKRHKSQSVLEQLANRAEELQLPDAGLTPFALAMPAQYRVACPVESYRSYYRGEKKHMATWKRNRPAWFDEDPK